MLLKFEVSSFKGFNKMLSLDFSNHRDYEFNPKLIKNDIIKNMIIYGKNGAGKSNLGLALFDIVFHLTDNDRNMEKSYLNYLNLDSKKKQARFYYKFKFDNDIVEYSYTKSSLNNILTEKLICNDEEIIISDHINCQHTQVNIDEAKLLNWDEDNSRISSIKYIYKNTKLSKENIIVKLVEFVDKMLFFRNVESNSFIGYKKTSDALDNVILDNNLLSDFESFLNQNGINYSLEVVENIPENRIGVRFENGVALFKDIISTGTKALWLFYCWKIYFKDVKFLFIDEFDANYHYEVAATIVKLLNEQFNCQVILTTHNTSLMNSELTRPDCVFELENGKIDSLSDSTSKELRFAHNIEKLYRSGKFKE